MSPGSLSPLQTKLLVALAGFEPASALTRGGARIAFRDELLLRLTDLDRL